MRKCAGPCGLNRQAKFFVSEKGRICLDCQRRKRKVSSHGARVQRTYGLTPAEYDAIFAFQNGACAICKGRRNYRLNVDHDHELERLNYSPRECVRGLLCRRCNGDLLTAARDDVTVLLAAAAYLSHPPAHAVLYPREAA
jgi:hypothetical protein